MSENHPVRIVRSPHDKQNPYVMTIRKTAQDRRLSYEARGLLIDLLSRSDGWEVRVIAMQIKGKAGREKVRRMLLELSHLGYVKMPERYKAKNGQFYWTPYEVFEEPRTGFQALDSSDGFPVDGEQGTGNTASKRVSTESIEEKVVKENKESFVSTENRNAFAFAYTAYETLTGHTINAQTKEKIELMATSYSKDWIEEAFKIAEDRGKRSLNYVMGILKNWETEKTTEVVYDDKNTVKLSEEELFDE